MSSIQSMDAAASSFAHQIFTPLLSELTRKVALVAVVIFAVIFVVVIRCIRADKISSEQKLQPFKQEIQKAQEKQQEAASHLKIAKEILDNLQKGETGSDAEFINLKKRCDEAKKRADETGQEYLKPGEEKDHERLQQAQHALQEAEAKAEEIFDAAWKVRQAKTKAAEEVCQKFYDKEQEISGIIWEKEKADRFEDEDKKTYTQAAREEDQRNYKKALQEVENAELELKEIKFATEKEWLETIDEVNQGDLKVAREHARKMERAFKVWEDAKELWRLAINDHEAAKTAYKKYKEKAVAKAQQEVDSAQEVLKAALKAAEDMLKRIQNLAKTANHEVKV